MDGSGATGVCQDGISGDDEQGEGGSSRCRFESGNLHGV